MEIRVLYGMLRKHCLPVVNNQTCEILGLRQYQTMKIILLLLSSISLASAQRPEMPRDTIFPNPPTSFEPRNVDGTQEIEPTIGPSRTKDEKITRYVSQLSLSELRSWTSSDGKVIEAKLIAFEDMSVETRDGATPPTPQPPKHPTVVRDGTVRLAVHRKPMVLALSRLSKADQEFIEKIRVQHAPKP